jgi:hypothetical protein
MSHYGKFLNLLMYVLKPCNVIDNILRRTNYAVNAFMIFENIFGNHQDIASTEMVLKQQDGGHRNIEYISDFTIH